MKVLWEIRDQGEEERRGHGLPGQGPLGCSLCSQTSPQAGEQLRACSPSLPHAPPHHGAPVPGSKL